MERFEKGPELSEAKQPETAISRFLESIKAEVEASIEPTNEELFDEWREGLLKDGWAQPPLSENPYERIKYAATADVSETPEVKGGSYSDIRKNMKERDDSGQDFEVHHMPADCVTDIVYNDGPAIKMEKADHSKTASWGKSKEAQEYRAAQKELVEQGNFREAAQMDIDDIRDKFGDKYDEAIAEYEAYYDKLVSEGTI